MRCPRCLSTNVVCEGRGRGHRCLDCGYDGTLRCTHEQETGDVCFECNPPRPGR